MKNEKQPSSVIPLDCRDAKRLKSPNICVSVLLVACDSTIVKNYVSEVWSLMQFIMRQILRESFLKAKIPVMNITIGLLWAWFKNLTWPPFTTYLNLPARRTQAEKSSKPR